PAGIDDGAVQTIVQEVRQVVVAALAVREVKDDGVLGNDAAAGCGAAAQLTNPKRVILPGQDSAGAAVEEELVPLILQAVGGHSILEVVHRVGDIAGQRDQDGCAGAASRPGRD